MMQILGGRSLDTRLVGMRASVLEKRVNFRESALEAAREGTPVTLRSRRCHVVATSSTC